MLVVNKKNEVVEVNDGQGFELVERHGWAIANGGQIAAYYGQLSADIDQTSHRAKEIKRHEAGVYSTLGIEKAVPENVATIITPADVRGDRIEEVEKQLDDQQAKAAKDAEKSAKDGSPVTISADQLANNTPAAAVAGGANPASASLLETPVSDGAPQEVKASKSQNEAAKAANREIEPARKASTGANPDASNKAS